MLIKTNLKKKKKEKKKTNLFSCHKTRDFIQLVFIKKILKDRWQWTLEGKLYKIIRCEVLEKVKCKYRETYVFSLTKLGQDNLCPNLKKAC